MSQLVANLFWILLVILGAGVLGWLLRRWSREGFACGAGGPDAQGGGGHGGKPGPLSYALEAEVDAHGNPLPRAELHAGLEADGARAALLAERDGLLHERDALRLDLDALRLKAQEGEALRARFLGEGGEASASGGYDLGLEAPAELTAARARIAELEALQNAGAPSLGLAAAPREVVRYVWAEGSGPDDPEGIPAPQAFATLQGELAQARARIASLEGGLGGGDVVGEAGSAELDAARARIAELEFEAEEAVELRSRAAAAKAETEAAYAELEALRADLSASEDEVEDEKSAADSEVWALRQDLEEARARIRALESGEAAEGDSAHFLTAAESASLERGEEGIFAELASARARIADLEAHQEPPREVVRYVWAEGSGGARSAPEDVEPAAFAALRAELDEARARLVRFEGEGTGEGTGALGLAASGDADLEALRTDLAEARNRLADAEAEANAALAQGTAVEADLTAARARIGELEAKGAEEAESWRVKFADLEDGAKTAADEEIVRLRGELAAAKGQAAELEAKGAEAAEAWGARLADLESGAGSAEAESGWTHLRAALEGDLAEARARIGELEAGAPAASPAANTEEADGLRLRLARLEAEASSASSNLEVLQTQLRAARARGDDLEARSAQDAEAWRGRLAALESGGASDWTQQRAALEGDLTQARLRIGALEEAASSASEASGADWTSLRAALEGDLAEARARIGELEAGAPAASPAASTEEADGLRLRLARLEAEASSASSNLEVLQTQLRAARARGDDLEARSAQDAEAWRGRLAALESGGASDWTHLRASLEGDLAEARARIGALEAKGAEEAESWRVKFAGLESGGGESDWTSLRASLEGDLAEARARIGELEGGAASPAANTEESDALRLRIARLEASASSASSEIELLHSQLRSARGRVSELEAASGSSGGALGLAGIGAGAAASGSVFAQASEADSLRLELEAARRRIDDLEQAEPRLEIREVIRYVERAPEAAADEDQPVTEEEREAEALIRSGTRDFARPELLLSAPRADEAQDDLKLIRGIGPKLEGLLNANGIYYFDQLGAFSPRDIAWIDGQLEEFPGRILRDRWAPQAREFARLKREGRLPTKSGGAKAGAVFAEAEEEAPSRAAAPKSVSAELTKVEAEALRLIDSGETFEGAVTLSTALPSPSRGEPDDLKRIRGVAYKLEEQLHELGIYYFSQIAEMSPREAAWLDWRLSLRGRVIRYRWIAQAQVFAAESEG